MPPFGEQSIGDDHGSSALTPASVAPSTSEGASDDDVVWVEGRGYSVKRFASVHPGGKTFVSAYGGRDATDAFATYHRRAFPHTSMQKYLVEDAPQPSKGPAPHTMDADFLELSKRVNDFLRRDGRGRGFAPSYYFAKAIFIFAVVLALEYSFILSPSWTKALVLGFFTALIGLNIQHDANHGSVSDKAWINVLFGLSQDWIGGNSLLWIQQHVVIHHVECNDLDSDKDMLENPLLRFSKYHSKFFWQRLQHLYFLALEAGYTVKIYVADWWNLLNNMYEGEPISRSVPQWRWVATYLFRAAWIARFVVAPLYLHAPMDWFPYFAVYAATGGFYLAFFFLISHNFEGVYHVVDGKLVPAVHPEEEKNPRDPTLLCRQVMTSSNVGGKWLAELNGGLNYQIEHHLFPRIHHAHYAAIAPIVRDYCKEKGIPYVHFPTVGDNLLSTMRFLKTQGWAEALKRSV